MKLYVLINASLSNAQKAVQAGHAVAEYMLDTENGWRNETLIYLRSHNIDDDLFMTGQEGHRFYEPDLGNILTAAACLEHPHLKKLEMEDFK